MGNHCPEKGRILVEPVLVGAVWVADDDLTIRRVSGLSKPKVTLGLDAKGPPTVGSGVMNLIPHFY